MKGTPKGIRRRQASPEELISTILGFISARFYQADPKSFAQDRSRLLKWVVLKPAAWLDERGVTVHPDDYRSLFVDQDNGLLMIALRHGNVEGIKYRPAWLGAAVESRLRIQGDRLYQMAKDHERRMSADIADRVVAALGGIATGRGPDPVRQLALAAAAVTLPKRAPKRPADAGQLSLL